MKNFLQVNLNLNQLNAMARNLWYKRSNTTGNSVSVDSSTDGGTTLAEYPGNHPVITQLSPRNHPLWDAIWKHVAMIFAVLVMSMANIGMAWGAYDVPANGKVTLSTKVNNDGRFNVEASGVYHFRKKDGYSWSSGDGIKTQSNLSGVIFYLNTSTEIEVGIKHTESKNAHDVTVHVYSIPESEYKQFDDNKAGAAESDRTFSTGPSTSSDNSFTISVTAESKTFTGTKTLAAGYYAVVPVGEKSKTFFTSIKFTSGGVTNPSFSPATGSSLVKSSGTVTLTSSGNTVYYKWSQTDNQYASGAGATLAGAADGSGTSPVNATAPSTAGTWYLYAVAYDGDDYSNVVKATYTITNPTHTLTWNLDGGTATGGTAAGAVAEGATLTAPTVTKVGYDFAGWSPAVPSTMPSSDATYTATWTKVYASGTYTFENNAALGTLPNKLTMTNGSDVAVAAGSRIDNLFFSAMTIRYESGTYSGSGDDFKGWKIKTDAATIKFFVENDCDVTIGVGNLTSGATITYTNQSGTVKENQSLTAKQDNTYSVKGGTMVTFKTSGESTVTLKKIQIGSSCTAPSSVSVAPTNANGWRYSLGETIDLTCTAEGGTGTKTYQWQKYIGSTWTDINTATNASAGTARLQIANCTSSDGGSYRCVVSTGATCSLESDGYWVRVFTLNGAYYGGSDTENAIVWTDANTGVATVHLNASSTYMFKVTDNDGRWFGNGENNYIIQPVALDCGTDNQKLRLLTGPEGDYTFTINVQHAADVSPYVNIATGYPTVSHPNSGYMYITKWWDCYIHYWEGESNALTTWGSDPKINSDRYVNICGTDYWYFPVIDTYNKFIAKNNTGDATDNNTTGNQETTGHGGQYITHSGSWGWQPFSTYTITYTGNGGGGSMSATSGICPDADQAITSNAFTAPTGCASFAHWTANVAVKVGDATVAAGSPIANGATIQDINSDITLTAVWKLAAPTITDKGDNTFSISGSIGGASYYYTIDGTTPTTSSSLYSAAVDFSAGEADITAKAIAHKDGYVDSEVASQACTYHAPAVCAISSCGNATLTYAINVGSSGDHSTGGADLISSATASNTTALGISTTPTYQTITMSDLTKKAAATTNTCFATAPNMTGKIGCYYGTVYSSTNYLQFTFTVKTGYTFTPCDIQFVVQPVSDEASFRWEVTDGTNVYGYGTGDAGVGSSAGATVLTGISSASAMNPGTYYIRLYPFSNYSKTKDGKTTYNTFRLGTDVILKGTTAEIVCSTPDDPDGLTAGSITTDGATFTISDDANTNNYEIYYSTSSTAPTAVTAATTTSDSKTKAVTGLTASTTYYAWVRSVCDASHKSDWVALSGSSFTTSAAAGDCHKYFYYGALSAPSPAPTKNENSFFSNIPSSGSSLSESWEIDGVTYTTSNRCGNSSNIGTFTVPSGKVATMYVMFNGGSSYTMTIKKGGSDYKTGIDASSGIKKYTEEDMGPGTYAVTTSGNVGLLLLIVDVCDDGPDETAPTFVSSVPANGATGVATSGTIVLTFSEALGTVDASKFTLTGATKGTVTIDGSDAAKVNITYSGAEEETTVTLATAAAAVSDLAGNALASALSNISFTTAAAGPATKDIYYGHVKITDGALVREIPSGATQFFTNIGGTVANTTEISLSSTPSTTGMYYNTNNLTDAELSKSSNWGTSSGSNRYVRGLKFANGTTYTLALGTKVASTITFYGWCGSASKTMTVGGEEFTSSATKETFAKHVFSKSGGFTGNVTITEDGDFYGILVITIQTATPCTTPVIPALSNQTVCPGSDIAAWDATQTAVLADGETASYSWKKKGNDTELANTATFDLGSSAAESQAGTYVVTVTVSKAGKASATATKEVTLTVTAAVEEPVITANKATIYPGNSVTLAATCGTDGVTWNWYLCANADGTGAGSSLGTSSSYTIASAGAAGTYYYKAVATGSCGTAERVYTLTVTAASECEKYFWFVYAADATSNGVVNNRDGFFTGAPTGSSNSSTYKFTLDGTEYTATKNTGSGSFSISFTIPEGSTASMGINCKGSSSKPLYLTHSSGTPQKLVSNSSSNASCTVENITEGTWTLTSAGSWTLAALGVQVCTTSTCTDATPTITAANTTVCVGSELSISSTGYETGATFQWQKLNGSAWDNISGAESATYTVTTAAAEHAGSYRLVATKGCARTSNTVTISVPSAPVFGSLGGARSVMTTSSLSITDVEASDATSYIWYKSANNTFEPGTDEQIGTSKDLIIGAVSEAANSTFYLFCVASNSCGSTTSGAITVNVTAYVEEDCATRDNMASAEFGFVNTSAGQGSYSSTACWTMNSNSKYLTYTAPEGKYFKTAKVTIASNSESKASYNWSTNGGTDYTAVSLTINSTLTERTINLSAHGNVNAIQIGRNFDSKGSSGGTLYVSKICFEYTEACTATTVTPSTSSVNYEMGGEWSNPTFTLSVAGTLTYSSSNEDIASVDDDGTITFNGEAGTVTITASYAGDETYCASTGSYTITVSCPGGAPKIVADGSVDMSGCNSSVTLLAKTQDDGDFADGTYQWFRNGEEIDGATSASYTARQAGTYTVARTNGTGCTSPSTNSAIVTSETTEPEVERLVPFQYYHVDKTYSDQMKMRHLFAVKNSGTLDGKHFKMYVSRNGGAATDVTSSAALVVEPNRDGQHIDTVMVDLNKLSGKYSENDEVVYTCKAIDCSGNVSDVYKNTITMRVIDATPTLALIISSDSVGDDFFRYKAKNLQEQTGGSAWSGEWPLYTYLKTRYNITPVNGYADFYKYNYEPFDILLLTDFPKTKPYGNPKNDNQKKQNTLARKALDDMADLCDFRPLLSFKTHMVQEETDLGHVSKWQAKGFTSNAVVPKTCQLRADIVCYAHPMFASLSTASSEINENKDNEAQKVFTLLSGEGYESGKVDGKEPKKGIQGFEVAAADNFVIIAYSHFDATATDLTGADAGKVHWEDKGKDRNLVAMCERQANIEARMILFSLNAGAHSKLTNAGMAVVDSCLQYLLDSDPLHVSDCSLVFDNNEGNGDGNWSTATNWLPTREEIPHANLAAHIKAPCTVNIPNASALNIRIEDEGSLIIPQGAALMVVNTIKRQDGRELSPTEVGDIHIGSSASGNGTLIFNNNDGDTKARVDMYSNAKADAGLSAAASTWQYIGTPHNDIGNAQRNYYDSWLYQYDTESQGWTVIENGGPLVPFRGYCVTHPAAPVVFDMEGTLVATTSYDISVPANKYVVAANSWVAPIDINAITSDDMEGFSDQAIYFFNTGSDPDKEGELDGGDRWAAGTYVSVPIHSAPYTGDDHIPSMQGFYVWSETAGTLHLDYEKHVRGTTRDNILSGPMHAPRRAKAAEEEEPAVLKIFARGSRYDDRLIVLEREDFTRRYESGWDGEAWGGSDLSPMVYITNEAGVDEAVSAIPEFEGTVITFKAGEDSEYRLDFVYDDEESLYLFDTENNTYTQIMTGESYYFSTDDKAPHSRFILTRRGPQIATGVGEVPSDQVQGTKAKKLLIENKMYILLNGALYDATGKAVK